MEMKKKVDNEKYIFKTNIESWESGYNGFTLRIIPKNDSLVNPFDDGLIYWFEED